jgi:hypothetical protein
MYADVHNYLRTLEYIHKVVNIRQKQVGLNTTSFEDLRRVAGLYLQDIMVEPTQTDVIYVGLIGVWSSLTRLQETTILELIQQIGRLPDLPDLATATLVSRKVGNTLEYMYGEITQTFPIITIPPSNETFLFNTLIDSHDISLPSALYRLFNTDVTIECFASFFDHQLPKYCSLQADNFFTTTVITETSTLVVHPPRQPRLLNLLAQHLTSLITKYPSLNVFAFLPAWPDHPGIHALQSVATVQYTTLDSYFAVLDGAPVQRNDGLLVWLYAAGSEDTASANLGTIVARTTGLVV